MTCKDCGCRSMQPVEAMTERGWEIWMRCDRCGGRYFKRAGRLSDREAK